VLFIRSSVACDLSAIYGDHVVRQETHQEIR